MTSLAKVTDRGRLKGDVLTDTTSKPALPAKASRPDRPHYDLRTLSYATSFDSPLRSNVIRSIEWLTGKITIVRMIREFERGGPYNGQDFWTSALRVLRIKITTPDEQLAHIPKTGPVVLVANHPHGMVDGMVMAELISRRRLDYKILTRSLLTDIDTVAGQFLIPVPFPHHPDAQEKMVEMRRAAMAHLEKGGLIALFPSGVVATSDSLFGPVIEREWNVFTAKMIRKSGATVVPCYFPGANSRMYQIAHQVSATLRQSLLIHEIVRSRGKPVKPVLAAPLDPDEFVRKLVEPRSFMAWLRQITLGLKDS